MALAATDGFDMYAGLVSDIGLQSKWTAVGGGLTGMSMGTGRFGGQCFVANAYFGGHMMARNFTASRTAGGQGFAFKVTSIPGGAVVPMFGIESNGLPQFGFYVSGVGAIVCCRAASSGGGSSIWSVGGTVLGSSAPGVIIAGLWSYLEFEWTLSSSAGTVTVYQEGVAVLTLTGLNNMAQTGAGYTNGDAFFMGNITNGDASYDDYYEADTNVRISPMRIDPVKGASDNAAAWTPSSGANNFSRTNETLVDGDTSYVATATVNAQDLYALGALPVVPATIFGVQRVDFARKTDANPRTINQTVKSGATTSLGPAKGLLTSYGRLERMMTVDPNTGVAWTPAAVTALLIGPNLAS